MPQLSGAVVLVTGANGGLGRHFVEQALARGASKVYAAARRPQEWHDARVIPLVLDVTDPASIRAAVAQAPDVTVLINNAGIAVESDTLLALPDEEFRNVMETNFFGPVALTKAFAPVLAASGTSAVLNIHSALSWIALTGAYSASKAALWSATNSFRVELAPQGTHVTGVHVAYIVIDAVIDVPWARERFKDKPDHFFIKPAAIAEEAWHLAHQDRSAWSFNVEVRPYAESW